MTLDKNRKRLKKHEIRGRHGKKILQEMEDSEDQEDMEAIQDLVWDLQEIGLFS